MPSPRLDIRTSDDVLERLDRVAGALSQPGVEVSRSGAARAAMLRGLDVLEHELGIATKEKKPARKPAAK